MIRQDFVKKGSEKGMVLVTCLFLIVVLVLLGSTAVMTSSTDLKIASNYRTGIQAFYAADSGIAEARARLKEDAANRISDTLPTDIGWRAYIGTQTKAHAKGYSNTDTKQSITPSLQTTLDYTVKIQHQVNPDDPSRVYYWGDANNDGRPERNPTTGQNIYLVTSYGSALSGNRAVSAEVSKVPPITVPGALYVNATTNIIGNANVLGVDQCGSAATSKPGVVSAQSSGVSTGNNTTITGVPQDIVYNAPVINVPQMIGSWRGAANYTYNVASSTQTGMNWGVPTQGATLQNPSSCNQNNIVYYNTSNGTNNTYVKLAGGTSGCGILLVDGDLEVNGGFSWYGVILVSGSVTYSGGGGKNVTGGIVAGNTVTAQVASSDTIGGGSNIVYCSSAVNNQTQNRPLITLTWMENM